MGHGRRGREFWSEVVRAYEVRGRGVTHRSFTEARGVSLHAFRIWLYRIRREQEHRAGVPGLVPVEIVDAGLGDDGFVAVGGQQAVDAAFPGGMVLRFAAGMDTRYVAELLCRVARGLA